MQVSTPALQWPVAAQTPMPHEVTNSSMVPSQSLSRLSQISGLTAGVQLSIPPLQKPVDMHAPEPHVVTNSSTMPSQSLSRLSQISAVAGRGLQVSTPTLQKPVELQLRPETRAEMRSTDAPYPEIPTITSNTQELLNKVQSWFANIQENIDVGQISAETSLRDDLEMNSLQAITVVIDLENEFRIIVEDEELEALETVGDIVRLVEAKAEGAS